MSCIASTLLLIVFSMSKSCVACQSILTDSSVKFCPECGAKVNVQAIGRQDKSEIDLNPNNLKRIPENNDWREIDVSIPASFSDDQQYQYNKAIAFLFALKNLDKLADTIKVGFSQYSYEYLYLSSDSYVEGFMKGAEKYGIQESTAKLAFIDYILNFILTFSPITINVFDKWPATGRSTGTLYIGEDGIKLESKRSQTVNLSFAEISSLGFGESQDLEQQGFRSTLYKGITLTVRAKNGSIFERHMFWGDTESDFNNGRQLIKSYISRIIDAGLPIQLIDDNGYNASGGYSVGFGMWFG